MRRPPKPALTHLNEQIDSLYVDLLIEIAKAGGHYQRLADGIHGWTERRPDGLWILLLVADHPGHGACRRYLDSLPFDCTIRIPHVTSERLRGMLHRRGFVPITTFDVPTNEPVELFIRPGIFAQRHARSELC